MGFVGAGKRLTKWVFSGGSAQVRRFEVDVSHNGIGNVADPTDLGPRKGLAAQRALQAEKRGDGREAASLWDGSKPYQSRITDEKNTFHIATTHDPASGVTRITLLGPQMPDVRDLLARACRTMRSWSDLGYEVVGGTKAMSRKIADGTADTIRINEHGGSIAYTVRISETAGRPGLHIMRSGLDFDALAKQAKEWGIGANKAQLTDLASKGHDRFIEQFDEHLAKIAKVLVDGEKVR